MLMHSSINHLIVSSHDPRTPSRPPLLHSSPSPTLTPIYSAAVTALAKHHVSSHIQFYRMPFHHHPLPFPSAPTPPRLSKEEEIAHTVNAQLAMPHDLLDLPLLLQIIEGFAREGTIDLEAIDEGGDGDETVGLHVLVEFVRGGLVEDDGMVGFVFDCFFEGARGAES